MDLVGQETIVRTILRYSMSRIMFGLVFTSLFLVGARDQLPLLLQVLIFNIFIIIIMNMIILFVFVELEDNDVPLGVLCMRHLHKSRDYMYRA